MAAGTGGSVVLEVCSLVGGAEPVRPHLAVAFGAALQAFRMHAERLDDADGHPLTVGFYLAGIADFFRHDRSFRHGVCGVNESGHRPTAPQTFPQPR